MNPGPGTVDYTMLCQLGQINFAEALPVDFGCGLLGTSLLIWIAELSELFALLISFSW